jgi:signal transduction histidine kinase
MNESGELQSFITSSRDVTEKVEVKREIEQVRKKVAQDFHDEMGNNLASISVLSQIIVRKLNGHDEEISALLHKIDLSSKNLFHGARDFIWAINPKNDNLKEVYFNLKDFGEDLFENTGIGFYATFEQPEQQVELKLPIGWSRQMVLIFKEALTNVLKYADCRSVRLNFLATQDFFRIELDDDGRGFDTETLEKSRGISNMQDRARKMRGQLEIKSLPGRGTRIVFRHKIPQLGGAMSQHV